MLFHIKWWYAIRVLYTLTHEPVIYHIIVYIKLIKGEIRKEYILGKMVNEIIIQKISIFNENIVKGTRRKIYKDTRREQMTLKDKVASLKRVQRFEKYIEKKNLNVVIDTAIKHPNFKG